MGDAALEGDPHSTNDDWPTDPDPGAVGPRRLYLILFVKERDRIFALATDYVLAARLVGVMLWPHWLMALNSGVAFRQNHRRKNVLLQKGQTGVHVPAWFELSHSLISTPGRTQRAHRRTSGGVDMRSCGIRSQLLCGSSAGFILRSRHQRSMTSALKRQSVPMRKPGNSPRRSSL